MVVQIPLQYLAFSTFGYIPRNGIAWSPSDSIFKFLRKLHTVFHRKCTNLHSHQECTRVPCSLNPCQHLLSFVFLMTAILTPVRWYLIAVLTCISMMISDNEHLFCVSIGHLYVFFGKMSIQFLCPFFNQMDWRGVLLSCMNSLYMLNINPLSNIWFANNFSGFSSNHINLPPFTFMRFWSKAWTSNDKSMGKDMSRGHSRLRTCMRKGIKVRNLMMFIKSYCKVYSHHINQNSCVNKGQCFKPKRKFITSSYKKIQALASGIGASRWSKNVIRNIFL